MKGMSNSRIMIVDDDPKLSGLLAIILNRMGGYEVKEENRSFSAVATARAFQPHLILLDVDMPGKDGGMVSAELNRDPKLSKVPIIFVTSLVSKNEAGMRNGKRYLAKPVDPHLLLDTVTALCPRCQPDVAA